MRQIAILMMLGALAAAGCCVERPAPMELGDTTLPADEGSAGFLDRMSSQQTVSQNDAMRGMLLLIDGKDTAADFSARADALSGKGVVGSWPLRAEAPITRGQLAYMVYQACDVPGGVMLTLTGPSERYCLRELQYRRMMGSGTGYNPVTGMEYVAVLTRADIFKRTGKFPDAVNNPAR